jgi:hypothetical protein
MNRAWEDGAAVFERIRTRCMHEMEGIGCPREVFVSSRDWRDLAGYVSAKARYEPNAAPVSGIQLMIDGNNLPVEVKDIGRIVLV